MRACEPGLSGFIERDGIKTYYEVHGDASPTILLLPSWSIVHSRVWKTQLPYLARHFRVILFDGRGNGRSDRPRGLEAYRSEEFVADAVAVLDATDTRSAILVGLSLGGHFAALLAAAHADRVLGVIFIAPAAPLGPPNPNRSADIFLSCLDSAEGWAKYNRAYWLKNYQDFLQFFFSEAFPEPHSSKQMEDCIAYASQTNAATLADTVMARFVPATDMEQTYRSIRCPCLVIHGDRDAIVPHAVGQRVAQVLGAPFITLKEAGHIPIARQPVMINLMIRDFAEAVAARKTAPPQRTPRTRGRVLFLSSPIGLGHARRDIAIARQLRELRPECRIDWLAQHPVTQLLQQAREAIHPASALLINESQHIESEAGEHDLNVFEALRRMDEALVSNFMLFQEVVAERRYELVIADESWEVDYFWHEHPHLKCATLAWCTDFVGFLPMPEGGEREAALTADYNADMRAHIAKHPTVRDRAIFVGNPDDVVDAAFGPDLASIRPWTERHFHFCGYITGFNREEFSDREALRHQYGFAHDEKVCITTVGGSGVGYALLKRIIEASIEVRKLIPALRFVVVAGPRIDARTLPRTAGVDIRGYIPDLHHQLAACDVAIVQGGLATCMELTALRVPFLYFPLRNHFEQNFHVRHRLERYAAGRCMDYARSTVEVIVRALIEALNTPVTFRPVESDGHIRAAKLLSDLLN